MREKLFLLLTLLCFAVSGVRAYEVQESYNTTQKKRTYESDYIKIVCDDFDSQGIKIGGLLDRFITITAKHATFKKVVLTVTHADYVREFRKSRGGGNLSIDGKTITITYSNNPTVVQYFSDHYDHFTIVDHIDVYYEPTDLAPNSAGEYSISNESEWVLFCKMVNEGGKTFSGKKVNMLNDISITGNTQNAATTMVGTKIVKNATIQNLRVADTIKCFSYSGGIIGATEGLVTLKNCHSEVNLTKYRDGGQDIGGLIGCCNSSGSLNIEGCCYTGPNVTLKSVTFTPASDLSNIISIDANTDNVYTFDMPESNVTVTYDYYLSNGSAAYDITWTGGEGTDMLAQVDGIKVINANAGDVVTITLSDDMKRQASDVTVKGATSNNSVNVTRASIQESVYTFTMPSEAVTVAATFKSAIYLMTANHCTIEASVNGGTPTLVDGWGGP